MDATEPQIGRATIREPSKRTAELLHELSACTTDADATRLVLQHASEAVDAELCVYADGDLTESATSDTTLVVPIHGRLRGHLLLARPDRPFAGGERDRIDSIARALSLFEPGQDLLARLALQDELTAALDRGQIGAYFLPRADLRTARASGVEALARWCHPERGVIQPEDFLHLADAGGFMPELTERVTQLAVQAAGDWWRSGLRIELTVNLPASLISQPAHGLADLISTALHRSGLPAKALRFDVTEDALLSGSDPAPALEALAALGAGISIDDFGTGHTSLPRLKSLAADELKIDRSLIRALARGGDKALVRSTIHLARQMGLRIVAEGVDTAEGWHQLRGMGCDAAQGFLIGAPMPAREFPAWLASWDARARGLNTIPRDRLDLTKPSRKRSHAPA